MPGQLVGARYELLAALGSGGMGLVFKARDCVLDELVALKILRAPPGAFLSGEDGVSPGKELVRRFRQEIKLARRVRHRNVCAIHEYGEEGDLLYISMELIDGCDLKRLIRQSSGLAWEEAYEIALQVVLGLQAVHEAGIIHRDLKPANLMRNRQGLIRVMDFGIAKLWDDDSGSGVTATGRVVGSPHYMSPEQVKGRPLDFRSDIYSFGVVLYEMFAGHPPFRGDTPVATMLQHVEDDPPLDGAIGARFPPGLSAILRRALAKQPGNRYATAAELEQALQEAAARPAAEGTDSVTSTGPLAAADRRRLEAGPQPAPPPEARLLLPYLVRAARHADAAVRRRAVAALVASGPLDDLSRHALDEARTDTDAEVRRRASQACHAEAGSPHPVPPSSGVVIDPLTDSDGSLGSGPDLASASPAPPAGVGSDSTPPPSPDAPPPPLVAARPGSRAVWVAAVIGVVIALALVGLLGPRRAARPASSEPAAASTPQPAPEGSTLPPASEPTPAPTDTVARDATPPPLGAGASRASEPAATPQRPVPASSLAGASPHPPPSLGGRFAPGRTSAPKPEGAGPSAAPESPKPPPRIDTVAPTPGVTTGGAERTSESSLPASPERDLAPAAVETAPSPEPTPTPEPVVSGSLVSGADPDVVPPEPRHTSPPEYPALARRLGRQGTVLLSVLVDETGRVAGAEVLRGLPSLDEAALKAVRQWRYEPATKRGVPVRIWIEVPVRFELRR